MPTPKQVIAARALLGMSQTQLSELSGIGYTSVSRFEGGGRSSSSTMDAISKVFQPHVEFIEDTGVKLKAPQIKIHHGRDGLIDFLKYVYDTVKTSGGEICVSNVNEKKFEELLGEEEDRAHMARMNSVKDLSFRVLIQEGDSYLPGDYCEYRWTPKERYRDVPLYMFKDKTAYIVFGEKPTIYVMSVPEITAMFKMQFDSLWASASEVKA